MSKKSLILDCTIRDGGIINDFDFTTDFVQKCIETVENSGCDYCEVGYIHDKKFVMSYDNFWKNIDIIELSKIIQKPKIKLSVMGDIGKFDSGLIPEKTSSVVVDLIRVAGPKEKLKEMLDLADEISLKGYETSINLMFSSHYTVSDWQEVVNIFNHSKFKPTFVYFADSFGNLKPYEIPAIIKCLKSIDNIQVGFHGHNHLQLAFANTLAAIENDADIVDSTIWGMGKGPGNLPTELILGYYNYDLKYLNLFVETEMQELHKKYEWGYLHKYLICGLHNASSRYGEFIMRDKSSCLNDVIKNIAKERLADRKSYKKDISNTKITAIIPIKLKNERLADKNIKLLGNKPLCHYIFETLLEVKRQYENLQIFVYCSDESFKKFLLPGIEFLKREKSLDQNCTNYTDIFSSFVKKVDSDLYVYTHATSPFIKPESISNAINKVLVEGYDSSFSVCKKNVFYWTNETSNYNLKNIPRTQDVEPIFMETSGFYVYKKEVFEKTQTRIGKTPFLYCVDRIEAVDIDEKDDFEVAQHILADGL